MKNFCTEIPAIEAAEWFAAKKYYEQKGSRLYISSILCVFGETEKALHVVLGTAFDVIITWIPKSCVKSVENDEYAKTYRCEDYTEAIELLKYIRGLYR